MNRPSRYLIPLFLAVQLVKAQAPPTSLQMLTPAPASALPSANVVGNRGISTYAYYVIANYPGGAAVSAPATVTQAPTTLTVSNYVTVGWNALAGVTTYDVVRLTPPATFSGNCASCAVATGLTSTGVSDNGGALASYTLGAGVVNGNGTLYVNTRDYTPPQLRQVINGVDLPVGTGSGVRNIGVTFAPDSTAGAVLNIAAIDFACTITKFHISAAAGSTTASVKLWKIATGGTAVPTVANSINSGSGFALSTGTKVDYEGAAVPAELTTTAIAAGDSLSFNLFAITGTSAINAILGCVQ